MISLWVPNKARKEPENDFSQNVRTKYEQFTGSANFKRALITSWQK